jgi:hypothetical protein
VTVLVLEAGGYEAGDKAIRELSFNSQSAVRDDHRLAVALASWGSQFGNPKYDWGFETVCIVATSPLAR